MEEIGDTQTTTRQHQWAEMTMQRVTVEGVWPDGDIAFTYSGDELAGISCMACQQPYTTETANTECLGQG